MDFSTLKINATIEPLYTLLYLIDDWVGDSSFNSYCETITKGLFDPSKLQHLTDIDETVEFPAAGLTLPKYGPVTLAEEKIYQKYYRMQNRPAKKRRKAKSNDAKSAPASNETPVSAKSADTHAHHTVAGAEEILTALERRMTYNEIIFHRVLACPEVYDISRRDAKFEDFIKFFNHIIYDSKGGYSDPASTLPANFEDRPLSTKIEYPPPPPPLKSNIYKRDGEGVIDMMRDLFGAGKHGEE